MKKIAGKIAMILVLVILVNSFTSCSQAVLSGLGILFLMGILYLCYGGLSYNPTDSGERIAISDEDEKSTFIEALCFLPLPEAELSTLREKLVSLPKTDIVSLVTTFNSLPDAERNYLTGKLLSLSETEIGDIVQGINSTPKKEIVSLIKKINSMPEKKLVSLVNDLQHFDACYSLDNKAYPGLRFQY